MSRSYPHAALIPPPPCSGPLCHPPQYGLELDPQQEALLGHHSRKPWTKFVNADNQHLATPAAIDFVDKLLRYDHQDRITSRDALQHPWFDPVRNAGSNSAGSPA